MPNELMDRRTRTWAIVAVLAGIALMLAVEVWEDPDKTFFGLLRELVAVVPVVLTSAGVVVLFLISRHQREETVSLIRDLEITRAQGHRWRSEARTLLNGLGEAIDTQFSRWNLTEAERSVALLLLKGLSLKEIAGLRATTERTIRAQAHALYAKAGVTGRASLSAFFLEDLLAPIGREEE